MARLRPWTGFLFGAGVGGVFGLAVALVLGTQRSSQAAAAGVAASLAVTCLVFAGMFGLVGLVVGALARWVSRTGGRLCLAPPREAGRPSPTEERRSVSQDSGYNPAAPGASPPDGDR